ncbi:resistin-like gamma isoform X1 [Polypterus senegalus]|nr:resistin-like gamma isoform X1 [Polypterus senegalus]
MTRPSSPSDSSGKSKPITSTMKIIIYLLAMAFVCSAQNDHLTLDEICAHRHGGQYQPSITKYLERVTLSCTSVYTRGKVSTCPTGYSPTGCACGYGCGSWDIQNEMTCHCQCANMDWTTARCCKLNIH